jgi:hypothetical protein
VTREHEGCRRVHVSSEAFVVVDLQREWFYNRPYFQ